MKNIKAMNIKGKSILYIKSMMFTNNEKSLPYLKTEAFNLSTELFCLVTQLLPLSFQLLDVLGSFLQHGCFTYLENS